jgi:hypothetical protein
MTVASEPKPGLIQSSHYLKKTFSIHGEWQRCISIPFISCVILLMDDVLHRVRWSVSVATSALVDAYVYGARLAQGTVTTRYCINSSGCRRPTTIT